MTFRISIAAITAGLLIAGGSVVLLSTADSASAQDLRAWQAGALSLAAPAGWQPPVVDKPELAPLDFSGDDWIAVLTDRPRAPDAGAMLVMRWSNDIPEDGDWPAAFPRVRAMLAGHNAQRTDWNDTELGWTGFEIVIPDASVGGKRFSLTCRSPSRNWAAVRPACERVVQSLQLAEAASPIVSTPSTSDSSGTDTASSIVPPPAVAEPVTSAGTVSLPAAINPETRGMATLIAVSAAFGAGIVGVAFFRVGRWRSGRIAALKLPPSIEASTAPAAIIARAVPQIAKPRFCTQCGAKVAAAGPCPKCGARE